MNNIEVYTAVVDRIDENALKKAIDSLPYWRRSYVEKKTMSEKINGAFAYLLLKYLVKEEYGEFDSAEFRYGENGKPYFARSKLFFSISHCTVAVGAAASRSQIGFDIMDFRNINEKIADKICSVSELEHYKTAIDKQEFLRTLWCKKESAVKRTGIGFTEGFKSADTQNQSFTLFSASNYIASVCGEGKVRFREVDAMKLI